MKIARANIDGGVRIQRHRRQGSGMGAWPRRAHRPADRGLLRHRHGRHVEPRASGDRDHQEPAVQRRAWLCAERQDLLGQLLRHQGAELGDCHQGVQRHQSELPRRKRGDLWRIVGRGSDQGLLRHTLPLSHRRPCVRQPDHDRSRVRQSQGVQHARRWQSQRRRRSHGAQLRLQESDLTAFGPRTSRSVCKRR